MRKFMIRSGVFHPDAERIEALVDALGEHVDPERRLPLHRELRGLVRARAHTIDTLGDSIRAGIAAATWARRRRQDESRRDIVTVWEAADVFGVVVTALHADVAEYADAVADAMPLVSGVFAQDADAVRTAVFPLTRAEKRVSETDALAQAEAQFIAAPRALWHAESAWGGVKRFLEREAA